MTRRSLIRAGAGTALLVGPLVLVALYGGLIAEPAGKRVVVSFLIALLLVVAIQTFSGNSGIVSFGHVAFMGVGAYAGALLTIPPATKASALPQLPQALLDVQLGLLPAVAVATIVTAVVAALVGLVLTRMEPYAMAMATIGVLVIFFVLFEAGKDVTRGTGGLYGIPSNVTLTVACVAAIATILVARLFRESSWGIKLRASRQDALAAEALGADVVRLRLGAWILSGALMGAGGALWAQYNLAFGPKQFFFTQTFDLLAMLVIGGMTTVSGAVAGAALITAATQLLRKLEGGFAIGGVEIAGMAGMTSILVAVLILVSLRARPEGLLGTRELDERIAIPTPWRRKRP